MVSNGVYIASLTTGWISFALTVLTWIGVYISLVITLRSAPSQIPLSLSNLRQELQAEKSLTKHEIREGDQFGVFPGRQIRRIGKNESHMRLQEITLNSVWKEFKALEARFVVRGDQRHMGEVEDTWSSMDSRSSEDEKEKWGDQKGGLKNRINGGRRMRRRESQLKSRMGFCEAGISVDRQTYYNTDFRHRILWWWKQDDVRHISKMIQRLQIRRLELEIYETNELVKRGLWVLGGMSGEDVLVHQGPPYSKNGGGRNVRRRRSHTKSKRTSSRSLNRPASRSASRARGGDDGVREVYEKEIRRTRRRSDSRGSAPESPARPAKVAGSTVSMSRKGESTRRSRAASTVDYEVVNPGRIWVDVEPSQNGPGRSPDTPRTNRPQPAHFESYVRERGGGQSRPVGVGKGKRASPHLDLPATASTRLKFEIFHILSYTTILQGNMDSGEMSTWPIVLADCLDQLLTFWHAHRANFVGVGIVLSLLLLWTLRGPRLQPPRASSPATQERASWLDHGDEKDAKQLFSSADSIQAKSRASIAASKKPKAAATRVVSGRKPLVQRKSAQQETTCSVRPYVFYASLTGGTKAVAESVLDSLTTLSDAINGIEKPELLDLSYIDLDDYFVSGPKNETYDDNTANFYLIIIPSYDIDSIITNFLEHLNETHNDFRIDTAPLSVLAGYSVFGTGDKEGWPSEEQGFCSQALEADKWMAKLTGRKRAYPIGLGDVKSNIQQASQEWTSGISQTLQDLLENGNLGEGVPGSGAPVESDDEVAEEDEEFPDRGRKKRQKLSNTTDLEDVGGKKSATPLAIDFTTYSNNPSSTQTQPKAMVPTTSPTYTALTKQGYTIVGTHSGVKICRWTKSALRGRGSCYKNSFYGIASHLCMETTPSLSCSNKCVFCWRHGTNPVSTTWRWQVDPPDLIFAGAKQGHYQKIKMMRGVPGVRSERFEEAMRIRHCALSLVGEPIFYPRINEFLSLLHSERISSFLVCNAQHPAQLESLHRVTQLYVSIDASNKDSLRKIDRPLHRDFWERFQSCLDILRTKRFIQRTVFRLTLVKGFNIDDEVQGYATLIERSLPCFIEIKGVTYCGTTSAAGAGLTMANVPFYHEIVSFVTALNTALEERGLEYGIAAEHAHSCCVLIASNRFKIGGKWNTRIDYERFFELLEGGGEFRPEDYCAETPEWALFGNGGFDPRDERVDRKGRPKGDDGGRESEVKRMMGGGDMGGSEMDMDMSIGAGGAGVVSGLKTGSLDF